MACDFPCVNVRLHAHARTQITHSKNHRHARAHIHTHNCTHLHTDQRPGKYFKRVPPAGGGGHDLKERSDAGGAGLMDFMGSSVPRQVGTHGTLHACARTQLYVLGWSSH